MYEELGGVREPVALSPQQALDSASALLARQGYEVTERTQTSLTVVRRKREGMFGHLLRNLTVAVRPLPQGGVQIHLRGDDKEGIQEKQSEWSRWAESLPKRGEGQQEGQERSQRVATSEASEMGSTEEPTPAMPIGSEASTSLHEHEQREEPGVGAVSEPEVPSEDTIGDEEQYPSPKDPGRWATVASWGQEPRVAAGKQPAEPVSPQERPSTANQTPSIDESTYEETPASDATIPKIVEAESFRLVNEKGEPRAVLGLSGDAPYLSLKGKDGQDRFRLQIGTEGDVPQLAMLDRNGNVRVYFALHQTDGSPTLALADDNGQPRFKIVHYEGKEPVLIFMDERGGTRIVLRQFQLGPDGSPALLIQDEHGREIRRLP